MQANTIRGVVAGFIAGFTLFHVATPVHEPQRIVIEEVAKPMPIEGIVLQPVVMPELPQPTRYFVAPLKLSAADMHCLAKNIYHEAGVETDDGKIAVGQVTVQRMQANRWKSDTTICKVVYRKAAFSWTLDAAKRKEKPKGELWEASVRAAKAVASGERIPGLDGALFYHADWMNKAPKWADKKHFVAQVDTHLFFDNDRKL